MQCFKTTQTEMTSDKSELMISASENVKRSITFYISMDKKRSVLDFSVMLSMSGYKTVVKV